MKTMGLLLILTAAALAVNGQPKPKPHEHNADLADKYAAKAKQHEAAAERAKSLQGHNAMQYKWPALAKGAENWHRDSAAEAHRIETQYREVAGVRTRR